MLTIPMKVASSSDNYIVGLAVDTTTPGLSIDHPTDIEAPSLPDAPVLLILTADGKLRLHPFHHAPHELRDELKDAYKVKVQRSAQMPGMATPAWVGRLKAAAADFSAVALTEPTPLRPTVRVEEPAEDDELAAAAAAALPSDDDFDDEEEPQTPPAAFTPEVTPKPAAFALAPLSTLSFAPKPAEDAAAVKPAFGFLAPPPAKPSIVTGFNFSAAAAGADGPASGAPTPSSGAPTAPAPAGGISGLFGGGRQTPPASPAAKAPMLGGAFAFATPPAAAAAASTTSLAASPAQDTTPTLLSKVPAALSPASKPLEEMAAAAKPAPAAVQLPPPPPPPPLQFPQSSNNPLFGQPPTPKSDAAPAAPAGNLWSKPPTEADKAGTVKPLAAAGFFAPAASKALGSLDGMKDGKSTASTALNGPSAPPPAPEEIEAPPKVPEPPVSLERLQSLVAATRATARGLQALKAQDAASFQTLDSVADQLRALLGDVQGTRVHMEGLKDVRGLNAAAPLPPQLTERRARLRELLGSTGASLDQLEGLVTAVESRDPLRYREQVLYGAAPLQGSDDLALPWARDAAADDARRLAFLFGKKGLTTRAVAPHPELLARATRALEAQALGLHAKLGLLSARLRDQFGVEVPEPSGHSALEGVGDSEDEQRGGAVQLLAGDFVVPTPVRPRLAAAAASARPLDPFMTPMPFRGGGEARGPSTPGPTRRSPFVPATARGAAAGTPWKTPAAVQSVCRTLVAKAAPAGAAGGGGARLVTPIKGGRPGSTDAAPAATAEPALRAEDLVDRLGAAIAARTLQWTEAPQPKDIDRILARPAAPTPAVASTSADRSASAPPRALPAAAPSPAAVRTPQPSGSGIATPSTFGVFGSGGGLSLSPSPMAFQGPPPVSPPPAVSLAGSSSANGAYESLDILTEYLPKIKSA